MNTLSKFFFYTSLLLIYLALARFVAPTKIDTFYVFNEETLSNIPKETPFSLILAGGHSTGYLIKTHYHKYRIVYGYDGFEEVIARVSSNFKARHQNNLGSSILRRGSDGKLSSNVLPPGSVFIGEKDFGRWVKIKDEKKWFFYRAYRHLKDYIGWSSYRPNFEEYLKIKDAIANKKNFYGSQMEFGTKGKVTANSFPQFTSTKQATFQDFKIFLKKYFLDNYNSGPKKL